MQNKVNVIFWSYCINQAKRIFSFSLLRYLQKVVGEACNRVIMVVFIQLTVWLVLIRNLVFKGKPIKLKVHIQSVYWKWSCSTVADGFRYKSKGDKSGERAGYSMVFFFFQSNVLNIRVHKVEEHHPVRSKTLFACQQMWVRKLFTRSNV